MITYNRFPDFKPDTDQIIYIIGNLGKDQLAIYKGSTRFDFYGSDRKGYYAKWWRPLNDVEQRSFDESLPVVRVKRKYTKRSIK